MPKSLNCKAINTTELVVQIDTDVNMLIEKYRLSTSVAHAVQQLLKSTVSNSRDRLLEAIQSIVKEVNTIKLDDKIGRAKLKACIDTRDFDSRIECIAARLGLGFYWEGASSTAVAIDAVAEMFTDTTVMEV